MICENIHLSVEQVMAELIKSQSQISLIFSYHFETGLRLKELIR